MSMFSVNQPIFLQKSLYSHKSQIFIWDWDLNLNLNLGVKEFNNRVSLVLAYNTHDGQKKAPHVDLGYCTTI